MSTKKLSRSYWLIIPVVLSGDAALLIDPNDVKGLADAMNKILVNGNGDMRNIMISKGYERVRDFSWKRCAEETLGIFEKVLSGKADVY